MISYIDNSMAYLAIFPVTSLLFKISSRVDEDGPQFGVPENNGTACEM
jgi:hypothetical protein